MNGSFALWVEKTYFKDILLLSTEEAYENARLPMFPALKKAMDQIGWRCHTQDVYIDEGSMPDIVLFLNIPTEREWRAFLKLSWNSRKWVLLQECEVIMPLNWDKKKHADFEKIFTWHDDYVDGKKYIKANYSHLFPLALEHSTAKEKLCTMIIANKSATHPKELYSQRLKAIEWFEKYHPEDFDFYGYGWDKAKIEIGNSILSRLINKLGFYRKLNHRCYRGVVNDKEKVFNKYKFAICYENAQDIPGYITEKIFDCFFSGCIPVYWGAPNVTQHIPSECFVDRREFSNLDQLYLYLKTMSKLEYENYLYNIHSFLFSERASQFRSNIFAATICKEI